MKQCRTALQTDLSSRLDVCRTVYRILGFSKNLCVSELIIITMAPAREKASRMEQNLEVASKALEDALARERYLGSQVAKYQDMVTKNGIAMKEAFEVRGKAAERMRVARSDWEKADGEVERKRVTLASGGPPSRRPG